MTKVSFLVISYNRPDNVDKIIRNIRGVSAEDYEIVVVDNGSDAPYSLDKKVRVVRNKVNERIQIARNIGIRSTKGKYVLMMDDDLEIVSKDFLPKALEILEKDEKVGAVLPKKIDHIKTDKGDKYVEAACCRIDIFGNLKFRKEKEGYVKCGVMTYLAKREVLDKIKGYSPIYGFNPKTGARGYAFREESDLHAKINESGYKLYYLPEWVVYHHIIKKGGYSDSPNKLYWTAYGNMIYIKRHASFSLIRRLLWFCILMGNIFLVYGLSSWREGLRGYVDGFRISLKEKNYLRAPYP